MAARSRWRLRLPLALAGLALGAALATPSAARPREQVRLPRAAAAAPGANQAWVARVVQRLAASEYAFAVEADGSLAAPNRAHGFRTSLRDSVLELTAREQEVEQGQATGFVVALSLAGAGRAEQIEPLGAIVDAEVAAATVRRAYSALSVEYTNGPAGLASRFTLVQAPTGTGPAVIALALGGSVGAFVTPNGATIVFEDVHEGPVVRWSDLRVTDAAGRDLPVEFEVAPGSVQITIDDDFAAYPLTAEGVLTSPPWTVASNQADAELGISVTTAGDVNADGFSDVIVGAYAFDNGQNNEGRAFLFLGSPSGLGATPAWTAEGNQSASFFGWSVATAGDVDGDGYSDVLVGAYQYDNGFTNEGRTALYRGSPDGLAPLPSWTFFGKQSFAFCGRSITTLGDVNGDGFDDVAIGLYVYDNDQADEGRVVVFHGSPSGLGSQPDWSAEGNKALARFGFGLASAGDVDADGYSDMVVGAYQYSNDQQFEGRVYLYRGSASGLEPTPHWFAEGNQATAQLGHSVSGAGDVNGDGFADIIAAANLYDNGHIDEGRVLLWLGSPDGPGSQPVWAMEADQTEAYLGHAIGSAGDVNGDGFADVIVGAWQFDGPAGTDEGRAWVYFGTKQGLGGKPAAVLEGRQAGAMFGYAVTTAGDVDGDGFSEVFVGAFGYDDGEENEGRALVWSGSPRGLALAPAWSAGGDPTAGYGSSVASAGDVNGDGFTDVVVGIVADPGVGTERGSAQLFLGGADGFGLEPDWTAHGSDPDARFGEAVASAGDVNGDGFADVVVGAPGQDGSFPDGGRVHVYHGSATGLALGPSWTADGERAGASLGSSVTGAGDVNGDGYADVLVGAFEHENGELGEGRVQLFLGSPSGLGSTAWTAEGNQERAMFGTTVAGAGDVNGDGYSDVLVGAPWYDGEHEDDGRAWLYPGSSTGLGAAAWIVAGNQSGEQFGGAVAGVGDVNGDGFSDVAIGASGWDGTVHLDAGRASVFFGSSSGLAGEPSWSVAGRRDSDALGAAVAAAGDVNGDGYADLAVGAPLAEDVERNEGQAYVYLGSPAGLTELRPFTLDLDQPAARFAAALAGVGDVNGDGFSDLVVSAPEADHGAGLVRLHLGGGGDGLARTRSQLQSDGSAVIALLGKSDAGASFLLRAVGRSAAGRTRVRLEFELKPLGVAFDGTGLVASPFGDTGAPGVAAGAFRSFDELLTAAPGPHVWRVRSVGADLRFPRSPWLVLSGNSARETDLVLLPIGRQRLAPR